MPDGPLMVLNDNGVGGSAKSAIGIRYVQGVFAKDTMKLQDVVDNKRSFLVPELKDSLHRVPVVENHAFIPSRGSSFLTNELPRQLARGGSQAFEYA